MAALSTIATLATIAAAATSTYSTLKDGKKKKGESAPITPPLQELTPPVTPPPAPDPKDTAKETERVLSSRKRTALKPGSKSGRSATLLTGPSGLSSPARSTLLGGG